MRSRESHLAVPGGGWGARKKGYFSHSQRRRKIRSQRGKGRDRKRQSHGTPSDPASVDEGIVLRKKNRLTKH